MNNSKNKNDILASSSLKSSLAEIDSSFDTIIIGGGIVGAGIFRDLSLHYVKTLLIDKNDFASQTSQASSKMFHGGIRYLESLDLALVWEALHEKNLWLKLTPQLCIEKPFCIPTYKESSHPLWQLNLGVKLYDLLSSYQNSPSTKLSKTAMQKKYSYLKQENLTGGVIYYDAIADDCKITLETIFDGLYANHNSAALNYVEIKNITKVDNSYSLELHDNLTSESKTITAQNVVFATGPFTDNLLPKLNFKNWQPALLPTKGSHIWLTRNSLDIENPVVLQTKDGRIIFVMPYIDKILVGTTEVVLKEVEFNIGPSNEEIEYILDNIKEYFPAFSKGKGNSSVISSYAGVRPLVLAEQSQTDQSSTKVSRHHKVFEIDKNIFVIVGGKLTTYRTMGQSISKKITMNYHGKQQYDANLTKRPFNYKSVILPFEKKSDITKEEIFKIIQYEKVKTFDDLVKRRIGTPSLSHWHYRQNFQEFFSSMVDELKTKIKISQTDIDSFK